MIFRFGNNGKKGGDYFPFVPKPFIPFRMKLREGCTFSQDVAALDQNDRIGGVLRLRMLKKEGIEHSRLERYLREAIEQAIREVTLEWELES